MMPLKSGLSFHIVVLLQQDLADGARPGFTGPAEDWPEVPGRLPNRLDSHRDRDDRSGCHPRQPVAVSADERRRTYAEERHDNFDIYLPLWLARHNKTIFGGLYAAALLFTLARWRGWIG